MTPTASPAAISPHTLSTSRDNVLTQTFTGISKGWEQWFLVSSDRHWDSVNSDRAMQKRHLELMLERGGLLIDNGDAFDLMQGRNDRRGSKSSLRPEHTNDAYFSSVINTAAEWFKPYAGNILMWAEGNHETSIRRHQEIDVTGHFLAELKAHGGQNIHRGRYANYVRFQFQRGTNKRLNNMVLFAHHGSGGSSPVTRGVIQSNRRAVTYPDADIIITGHLHSEWLVPIRRERITQRGIIYDKRQYHVSVGTYKQTPHDRGWEVEMGMGRPSVGAVWMRFYYCSATDEVKVEFTLAE